MLKRANAEFEDIGWIFWPVHCKTILTNSNLTLFHSHSCLQFYQQRKPLNAQILEFKSKMN